MSASQAEHGGSIPLTCSTLPDACAFGSFIMTAKASRIRANVYKTVAFPTTMSTESKWLVSLALKSINIPADRISSAAKFIYIQLDAKWICEIYTLPSRPTIIKYLILTAFRHFLFIWKRKRLQKKSKLCPQKGKQASLKSKSFCAMPRKKRLKCGRIPARLFLACHQKSNIFKCKQFCCAKPMCACLFMGCAPRPHNATPQYKVCG